MTSPTPIAHITAPGAFGGLERVVSGLAAGLASTGRRIVLVTVLDPGTPLPHWAAQLRDAGVSVEPVRVPNRAYLHERRAVLAVLRSAKVGIVHTHGYRADVVAGGMAIDEGIPTVSTVHGFTRLGLRNRLYEWLQLRALKRLSAVVAVSRSLQTELAARGVDPSRIALIPNRVALTARDLLDRDAARARLGLPADGVVVGWVGRLSEEKAPALFVEAAALVTHASATFCVVGDGAELAACRALAERLGLGARMHFAGPVPDAGPLFSAFDAFVLSSRTEGTPMALLEAGVAGIPVVATAVGGVPDLLGPDDGWLVPPGDAGVLARAIDHLLGDPVAAARRAGAFQARVGQQDVGSWIGKYADLYDRVAGAGMSPHQSNSTR